MLGRKTRSRLIMPHVVRSLDLGYRPGCAGSASCAKCDIVALNYVMLGYTSVDGFRPAQPRCMPGFSVLPGIVTTDAAPVD